MALNGECDAIRKGFKGFGFVQRADKRRLLEVIVGSYVTQIDHKFCGVHQILQNPATPCLYNFYSMFLTVLTTVDE